MGWLNPKNIEGDRFAGEAEKEVESFLAQEGLVGKLILGAFQEIDPMGSYSESFSHRSDEYLLQAKQTLAELKKLKLSRQNISLEDVCRCIKGIFTPRDIKFYSINEAKIDAIARIIFPKVIKIVG